MGYFGIPFRNGVPIGLGSVASFGAQQFDPSSLFIGGTAGTFYDPSDPTTLFTTSTGTTPCAVPGSGSQVLVGLMLDKSQGAPGALGAELVTTPYSGPTSGTWAISSTSVTRNSSTGGQATLILIGAISTSKWYQVQFTVANLSGDTFFYRIGGGTAYQITSNGVYTARVVGGGAASSLVFAPWAGGAGEATITNISVREIPGNHAIAFNDTTARPELSARVNLLVATATLSTQNVTTQATSYTLCFAGTGSITLSGTATGSYSAGTHTITCTAGTLTLTVSGTVTTADLRPANSGALLPAYQAVVDANTYDSNGFPSYLRFDGVDDSMYTPASINFSGTDKMSVFAGVRKLSDAAVGMFAELSAAAAINNGSFYVAAPESTGASGNYTFLCGGTAGLTSISSGTLLAPNTSVLTGIGEISTDTKLLRINGAQVASSAGDQGTGNFGTYPLYIGSRNNSSLRFNGYLYSLIVAGTQLQSGSITATEQYVAGKTGVQI